VTTTPGMSTDAPITKTTTTTAGLFCHRRNTLAAAAPASLHHACPTRATYQRPVDLPADAAAHVVGEGMAAVDPA
jgi:hypothetical protein